MIFYNIFGEYRNIEHFKSKPKPKPKSKSKSKSVSTPTQQIISTSQQPSLVPNILNTNNLLERATAKVSESIRREQVSSKECIGYDSSNNIPYTFNNVSEYKDNNLECVILPIKIKDLNNNYYIITNQDHGYEIFLQNHHKSNKIFIDSLKYNFNTIINTNFMVPSGSLKILSNKQQIILLNNLNKNQLTTFDDNNNFCTNKYDNQQSYYNMNLQNDLSNNIILDISNNKISYTGNPKIFIYGDIPPCNKQYIGDPIKDNNGIYVYFDYNVSTPNINNICLDKLRITKMTMGNSTNINPNFHGIEFIEKNNKNFQINFNPNSPDLKFPYGFTTIIDTKNINIVDISNAELPGKISVHPSLIEDMNKRKKGCVNFNFYISNIDLTDNKVWITNKKGPFPSIIYYGKPKIIIHIPPFVLSSLPVNYKNYQTDKNNIDIYVNMIY